MGNTTEPESKFLELAGSLTAEFDPGPRAHYIPKTVLQAAQWGQQWRQTHDVGKKLEEAIKDWALCPEDWPCPLVRPSAGCPGKTLQGVEGTGEEKGNESELRSKIGKADPPNRWRFTPGLLGSPCSQVKCSQRNGCLVQHLTQSWETTGWGCRRESHLIARRAGETLGPDKSTPGNFCQWRNHVNPAGLLNDTIRGACEVSFYLGALIFPLGQI